MNTILFDEIIETIKYHLESKANSYVSLDSLMYWLKKNNENTEISLNDINLAIQDFISELRELDTGLCYHNQLFYYKDIKDAEDEIINYIKTIPILSSVSTISEETIDSTIYTLELTGKIKFTPLQIAAVNEAFNNRFSIVTGGPGTGKTTIIEAIASAWSKHGEVRIWAPTGKASQRITEATGFYACTIHQGLKEENMVGGLLIIDEASMIDSYLMSQILKYNCCNNIILIGDADQIPSIGSGDVFYDLLHIKGITATRLDQGFRSDNTIVKNSKRLLYKETLINFDYNESFLFINQKQIPIDIEMDENQERRLEKLRAEKVLQETYNLWNYLLQQCQDIKDVMILVPLRKEDEDAGRHVTTDTINRYIQKRRFHGINTEKVGSFYINDRVIYNKNRYDIKPINKNVGIELYNGMLGTVIKVEGKKWLQVEFDNGAVFRLPANDENLGLAYALTVHKAQGSEFKRILFVSPDSKFHNRPLFYTAITRAKEQVIMFGRFDAFTWLLLDMEDRRDTFLKMHFRISKDPEQFLKYDDKDKWPDECAVRDKNILRFLNDKSWVSNAKDSIVKSKAMVRADYNMDLDIYDMRLISMYFAKIKVCDITTRRVTITKSDFIKYFGKKIDGEYWTALPEKHEQLSIDIDGIDYKRTENNVDLWPYKKKNRKGKTQRKFWKEIYFQNNELVCNISDDLLRHTFGIEESMGYIMYDIAYLAHLTSGQIQFYEYARQYLNNKKEPFEVTIGKLRKLLHLKNEEYLEKDDLKRCVKRLCTAINKYTDLKIEPQYHNNKADNNQTYYYCTFAVTNSLPEECRRIEMEVEEVVVPKPQIKIKNKTVVKVRRNEIRKWKTVTNPYTGTEYLRLVEKEKLFNNKYING
jgi:RecD/TraA family predicted helicase